MPKAPARSSPVGALDSISVGRLTFLPASLGRFLQGQARFVPEPARPWPRPHLGRRHAASPPEWNRPQGPNARPSVAKALQNGLFPPSAPCRRATACLRLPPPKRRFRKCLQPLINHPSDNTTTSELSRVCGVSLVQGPGSKSHAYADYSHWATPDERTSKGFVLCNIAHIMSCPR
jgi:hypothetical protein